MDVWAYTITRDSHAYIHPYYSQNCSQHPDFLEYVLGFLFFYLTISIYTIQITLNHLFILGASVGWCLVSNRKVIIKFETLFNQFLADSKAIFCDVTLNVPLSFKYILLAPQVER